MSQQCQPRIQVAFCKDLRRDKKIILAYLSIGVFKYWRKKRAKKKLARVGRSWRTVIL